MSRATYFSLLEEGLTAAAIMMLSEQTPPGVSWVPLLVVPLSRPPQSLYLCAHKCFCG